MKYRLGGMVEPITTSQFWVTSPQNGEIIEAGLSPRLDDELLVRTIYSGVSRGTESLVFKGKVPRSQYESMRAPFQEGNFPGPVKYGYSNVGEVVDGPDEFVGRVVFCLYPHQTRYVVNSNAVAVLPEGLPPARAVLAANMETAVNVVWDACPAVGDRIVVIGGGVVGLLAAWLCGQVPGVEVTLVDVNSSRGSVASVLGLEFCTEVQPHGRADLVIHASGQPEGLASALKVAGMEATIVEASWYGDGIVELPLGEEFHARRLMVKSSQVGQLPPHRAPRWTRAKRLELALSLLQEPQLDRLITGESRFEELPVLMRELSQAPGSTLCHRIVY